MKAICRKCKTAEDTFYSCGVFECERCGYLITGAFYRAPLPKIETVDNGEHCHDDIAPMPDTWEYFQGGAVRNNRDGGQEILRYNFYLQKYQHI